jgi:hypothetical protein
MLLTNDEDDQSQEDENNSDFDAALSDAQVYEFLGKAIHVLDQILLCEKRT